MSIRCMTVAASNIYSSSDFQRNTRDHIDKLKQSGTPAVLTVNGQAEVVVQSAAAYQKLLEDQVRDFRCAIDYLETRSDIARTASRCSPSAPEPPLRRFPWPWRTG